MEFKNKSKKEIFLFTNWKKKETYLYSILIRLHPL